MSRDEKELLMLLAEKDLEAMKYELAKLEKRRTLTIEHADSAPPGSYLAKKRMPVEALDKMIEKQKELIEKMDVYICRVRG